LADRSQAAPPNLSNAVGRGLRASPHRARPPRPFLIAGSVVIVASLLGGAGLLGTLTGFWSSPTKRSVVGADATTRGSSAPPDNGAPEPGTVPGFPTHIGNTQLTAVQYAAPDVLTKPGGDVMEAMLTRLGVDPAGVHLTAAIDPDRRLSLGVWTVPAIQAAALLEAWQAVAGRSNGWEADQFAGQSVLVAHVASGRTAYAAATEGRFIYIVTSDPLLAAAALTALG
jgi:hypothetical protein